MTIRLTIKNEDTREKAIVAVVSKDAASGLPIEYKQLHAGESTVVYVHPTKEISIKEIQNG